MFIRKKILTPFRFVLLVFWSIVILTLSHQPLTINHVFAQSTNPLDVTVSPIYFDLSTDPGKTLSETFRVRNNTGSALNLVVSVDKLVANGDNVAPAPATPEDKYLSWIKFDNEQIKALPREWTDVKFTIDVPQDAAFGYYYSIHVTQTGTTVNGKSGAKLKGEALIPILLNVKSPNAIAKISLLKFEPASFVSQFLPVNFSAQFENDGNVHVVPLGNIFIRQGNKDISILDVNPGGGNILPNGSRTFTSSWDDGFITYEPKTDSNGNVIPDKNGKPQTQLTINWDKLTHTRIGKYTAQLVAVYNNGTRDETITSSTTFWVLPWAIIGGVLIGIIVIILVVRALLRSYINAQVRKAERK